MSTNDIKLLLETYEKWKEDVIDADINKKLEPIDIKELYNFSRDSLLKNVQVETIDNRILQDFVREMENGDFKDFKLRTHYPSTGVFFSTVANQIKDKKIGIEINRPWNHIGIFNNGKTYNIEGSTGEESGLGMKSGKIIINGDTDCSTGAYLEGGEIYIKGSVSTLLGWEMKGGKIVVEGDVDASVFGIGAGMKGGTIEIYGNLDLGKMTRFGEGGKIYHKGKLIRESGKRYA